MIYIHVSNWYIGAEKRRGEAYKNPIQGLRIMRRRQNTRILHMPLQIPELLQPNPAHIHDIRRRHDSCLRVRPFQHRTQRRHEAEQVFVQREQSQQSLGHGGGFLGFLRQIRGGHGFVVGGHVFGVQMLDFENVDGDSAAVATAGPLGVLYSF